jgi:hypothetical protein
MNSFSVTEDVDSSSPSQKPVSDTTLRDDGYDISVQIGLLVTTG